MKKILSTLCFFAACAIVFCSCSNTETYADKRKKEDAAISQFISRDLEISKTLMSQPISVISETDFEKAGYSTDTTKNQYVLFETSGVYMQIINKGCGSKIESGDKTNVLVRFDEYNILGDSLQMSDVNPRSAYTFNPDKMMVLNSYGTFTGIFTGNSYMTSVYGSTSVPSGWLIPLRYVNIGRPANENESLAKVRVIVPSAQGQSEASSYTYPCFYELTYERAE